MSDPPPQSDGGVMERVEHLQHWYREPLAGLAAIGVACWDTWHYGRDAGFTSSVDEILVLTGVALIAGIRNLFGAKPPDPEKP